MDWFALVVAVLSIVAVSLATGESLSVRRVAVRRRVVVSLVDDQAITGILWRRHRRFVVLRSAELVAPGREPVRMNGDVVIERDRINWVQITGAD